MKLLQAMLLLIITSTLMSVSCKKVDTGNSQAVGTWRITAYWDKKDETSKFAGYTFYIHAGGHIQAGKGTQVFDGVWSETGTRFVVDFGPDPVLSSINGDWLKENITPTDMKVKDDNPANDEWVQFTRN